VMHGTWRKAKVFASQRAGRQNGFARVSQSIETAMKIANFSNLRKSPYIGLFLAENQ